MNLERHTHEVKVRIDHSDMMPTTRITYGDEEGRVYQRGPFYNWRLRRRIREVIRRHDRGTRLTGTEFDPKVIAQREAERTAGREWEDKASVSAHRVAVVAVAITEGTAYRAECSCGQIGPMHAESRQAAFDATAHEQAVKP